MSVFETYLELGFRHITDPGGYDHMLFLLALCAPFTFREIRKVLILVTAFTLGHSLTLALSVLAGPILPSGTVETLIPVTILAAALLNVLRVRQTRPVAWPAYLTAMFFGLIHGMGFSNFLRALLGAEQSLWKPLLAFNLGLEAGQILVVALVLGLATLVVRLAGLPLRWWTLVCSVAAGGWAAWMLTGF